MKTRTIIIATLFFLLGTFLTILIVTPQITKATTLLEKGDRAKAIGRPVTALRAYEQAAKEWPIIQFYGSYKTKLAQIRQDVALHKPQVTIFLRNSSSQEEISMLQAELTKMEGVESIKYTSKQEALKKYKQINKNEPALLELVTADILPASISVSVQDDEIKERIKNSVKNNPLVEIVIVSPPL